MCQHTPQDCVKHAYEPVLRNNGNDIGGSWIDAPIIRIATGIQIYWLDGSSLPTSDT